MADKSNKKQYKDVDQAGIRLAPTPMNNNDYSILPSVRQDYILSPKIVIDEPQEEETKGSTTAKDFQPKKEDISKKWKREKRLKNLIVGSIMLVFSLFILLPYILKPLGAGLEWGFQFTPIKYDVFGDLIDAFTISINNGWTGYDVGDAWIMTIKDIIVLVGIVFVLVNIIKSLYAMFAAVKPIKYMFGGFMYLGVCVLVFCCALMGIPEIGIDRIYFLGDFIYGFRTCEYFTLIVFSIGYFIVCLICTLVNEDKNGYLS